MTRKREDERDSSWQRESDQSWAPWELLLPRELRATGPLGCTCAAVDACGAGSAQAAPAYSHICQKQGVGGTDCTHYISQYPPTSCWVCVCLCVILGELITHRTIFTCVIADVHADMAQCVCVCALSWLIFSYKNFWINPSINFSQSTSQSSLTRFHLPLNIKQSTS